MRPTLLVGLSHRDYIRHYIYLCILRATKEDDRVLEIGCGTETGPAHLGPPLIAKSVKEYLGADKKEWKNPEFNFLQADIEEWEPDGLYDKIICLQTIAYVDPYKLAEKIHRHLAPDGAAYLCETMRWRDGGGKSTPKEIADGFEDVLKVFGNVRLLGIDKGILVPLTDATTGVFAIAKH